MDLLRINELGLEQISELHRLILVVALSFWWNVLITCQCYLIFLLTTWEFAFHYKFEKLLFLVYAIDFCYLFDIVCTLAYLRNRAIRKLKFVKMRHGIFIILDIISLIPMRLLCTFLYVSEHKNSLVIGILLQNKALRIYRVFLLESAYMRTIRTYGKFLCFTLVSLINKSFLVSHSLACIWYNVERSVSCDPKRFNCYLWYVTNMTQIVLMCWSGPQHMFAFLPEKIIVICAMLAGLILIYGFIIPYVFYFTLVLSYNESTYYSKLEKLKKFLDNLFLKGSIRRKVLHHFNYIWSEGEENLNMENLLSGIPIADRKEICSDIYWEAFRHSYLFRESSISFKRSLSLVMTTEYHHDGEVIYYKGQEKRKMIYLVQGALQVMAEENENKPLLSFSSGTVFGELSLFLFTSSNTVVRCNGFCELQILTYRNVTTAMMDYSKDRKHIFRKITQRILMAKHTQWRKKKLKGEQTLETLSPDSYFVVEDCVKWLKNQWKKVFTNHKRHLEVIKAKQEGTRLPSFQNAERPDAGIEFISNYLDLFVLSNLIEKNANMVCLHSQFPWAIQPSAPFLRIWRFIVLVASLVPGFAYPVSTAWCQPFPNGVFLLSYVVTLIYMADVLLKLFTAVQTRHQIIDKFSSVLCYHLTKPSFYVDVVAAFPYQFFLPKHVDRATDKSYKIGLLLHPAILKAYIFFSLKIPLGPYMLWITVLKNCVIYFLLLYWLSEAIQLHSIINIFNLQIDWIDRFLDSVQDGNMAFLRSYCLSFFKTLVVAISKPTTSSYADEDFGLVFGLVARYSFYLYSAYFMGDLCFCVLIKSFSQELFVARSKRIKGFLLKKKISNVILSQVTRDIEFQWDYNKGSNLTADFGAFKEMPHNLRREVFYESIYQTLKLTSLFKDESEEFLMEVLDSCEFLAVPRGSLLVTYGQISHVIFVINRGHCQLSSHLVNDVKNNLGWTFTVGPGRAFPVLSAFCSLQCPLTVVSSTDCEIMMMDVNKLITIMIKYNFFKDLVDTLKEGDILAKLTNTKPAFLRVNRGDALPEDTARFFAEIYKRFGRFAKVLLFCFTTQNVSDTWAFLRSWEYSYTFYLLLVTVVWPCCFGLLIYASHVLIPIFLFLKIMVIAHIFLGSFTPYFDNKGLLVFHPLQTFTHYLKSSFILDFIRWLPAFEIYYYGSWNSREMFDTYVVILAFLQNSLNVVNLLGCIDYVGRKFLSKYYLEIIKCGVAMGILLNMAVNFAMFIFAEWQFSGTRRIIGFDMVEAHRITSRSLLAKNNTLDYYNLMTYWWLTSLSSNFYHLTKLRKLQLYLTYFVIPFGVLIDYGITVLLSCSTKIMNISGVKYQEKFAALIRYLKREGVNETYVEHLKAFYNYQLAKMQGEDCNEIFSELPAYLKEELWYPLIRPTLINNNIFEDADEGFFRVLAAHVRLIFFTRGSVVIFRDEVQSDIFFVHRGKCFVYDWFMILDIGSIIGDIHQGKMMQNNVYALTHVEMFQISSKEFFTILNNFDTLEANFQYAVEKAESFLKSDIYRDYFPVRPVDSEDAISAFDLKKKRIDFEDQSFFEDPGAAKILGFTSRKLKYEAKKLLLYPSSWKMNFWLILAFADIVLIFFFVPMFIGFAGLSDAAFIIFGILDFYFLVFMIMTFRMAIVNVETGDVISNFIFIAYKYLKREFALDLISLIPFEVIPLCIAWDRHKANPEAVAFLRLTRYIRVYSFYKYRGTDFGFMKTEVYRKCFFFAIFFFWCIFLSAIIYMRISREPAIVAANDPFVFKFEQFKACVLALEYVINFLSSSNIYLIFPTSRIEVVHFNISLIVLVCLKGKLLSHILAVIHFSNLTTFNYTAEVTLLESMLQKKETSPCLVRNVINYKKNLFEYSQSGNPRFLNKIPNSIRILLTKNLYFRHLDNFPLFNNLDAVFINQLTARVKKEVYFPGQLITHQGDVDKRFFFIHSGEVYVINHTKSQYEYVVERLVAGQYFGESQGLWYVIPQSHTYRGRTVVEIVSLNSSDWEDLRKAYPKITKIIFERARSLKFL